MTTVCGTDHPIITFRIGRKLGAVEENIASGNGAVDAIYLAGVAVGHIETTAYTGPRTGGRTGVFGTEHTIFTQGSGGCVLTIKQDVAAVDGTSDAVITG